MSTAMSFEEWKEISEHVITHGGSRPTYNVNHSACGDRRKRLYITRKEAPTRWLAYCHNCNKHAVVMAESDATVPAPLLVEAAEEAERLSSRARTYDSTSDKTITITKAAFALPDVQCFVESPSMIVGTGPWSKRAVLEVLENHQVLYSESTGRLRYPVFRVQASEPPILIGGQLRALDKTCKVKYLTFREEGMKDESLQELVYENNEWYVAQSVVIVEDLPSAWAVASKKYGIVGLPLLGTNIEVGTMLLLAKELKNTPVFIWLDNDRDDIKLKSVKLAETLRTIGLPKVFAILEYIEPKKCTGGKEFFIRTLETHYKQ